MKIGFTYKFKKSFTKAPTQFQIYTFLMINIEELLNNLMAQLIVLFSDLKL